MRTHRSHRFWLHLLDNLFRRFFFYALPIVLFFLIGGLLAQRSTVEYTSSATLDVANNPLVEELDVRGDDSLFRQSKADSTADFINEQLRTQAFVSAVATSAGLGDQLTAGLITGTTIRSQVSVRANGDSIIVVSGTWSDPATAQNLTQATIDSYRDYVVDTVANDSIAAEAFFTELLDRAVDQRDDAEDALDDYVSSLGPLLDGEDRPVVETLTIDRLNSALVRSEASVETARAAIESARLEVAKSRSEAGLSVRLIDPPELPLQPEPRLFAMAGLVLMFLILGVLTSATALIVTTALDKTIRFEFDLAHTTKNPYVSSARLLRKSRRRRRKSSKPRPSTVATSGIDVGVDDATVGTQSNQPHGDSPSDSEPRAAASDESTARDNLLSGLLTERKR